MSPRRTTQRQAVLRAVKISGQPVSAEEIYGVVATQSVAQATVYRNLEWLSRRGEIYRYTDEDGVTRYIGHATQVADFQCQQCGEKQDLKIDASTIVEGIHQYGQPGFVRIQISGLCNNCCKKL